MPKTNPAHRFFTGSFYPELEAPLGREIADYKRANGPLAPLIILVPTNLLRVYLPRRVAESFGGHANLRFQTLGDLVRTLAPADLQTLPPLGEPDAQDLRAIERLRSQRVQWMCAHKKSLSRMNAGRARSTPSRLADAVEAAEEAARRREGETAIAAAAASFGTAMHEARRMWNVTGRSWKRTPKRCKPLAARDLLKFSCFSGREKR